MTEKLTRTLCALVAAILMIAACSAETLKVDQTEYVPKDDATHQKIVETWEYYVEKDGSYGSGHPYAESSSIEVHVFGDAGACLSCGYVKGTYESAGAPAGADAAAYEGLGMAEVLMLVAERLADSNGTIANADGIFSADEAGKLARLPMREQMLVLLAALDQAQDEALSDDAQALLDAIRARTTAEALLEGFPGETVALDGAAVECCVVEFAFDSADGRALERYAFRKDNLLFARLTAEP